MSEEYQPDEEKEERDTKARSQLSEVNGPRAEKAQPEPLHHGCQRVELENPPIALGYRRQWIDHRSGIHQQLDAEGDQVRQVTIARGQRTNDDAAPQAVAG